MASKQANKRLTKEFLGVQKSPVPYIVTKPKEDNILEWHYVISGPEDSPYAGGEYWGKLIFPADYPFKPPGIRIMTPNGRFKTDYRLCLSMSDYHPDTWNPSWSVSTILTGLLSFMLEDTSTTGSIQTTTAEKKILAKQSATYNRSVAQFKDLFPELLKLESEIGSSASVPNTLHQLPLDKQHQNQNLQQQNSNNHQQQLQNVKNRRRPSKSEEEKGKNESPELLTNPLTLTSARLWIGLQRATVFILFFVCFLVVIKLCERNTF